jgi:hypothetical protein
MEIVTISEKLSIQLLNHLNELGLRTTRYNWFSKQGNRKRAYKISIRGDKMIHKFIQIIKPANPKHIKKYISYKESFK